MFLWMGCNEWLGWFRQSSNNCVRRAYCGARCHDVFRRSVCRLMAHVVVCMYLGFSSSFSLARMWKVMIVDYVCL